MSRIGQLSIFFISIVLSISSFAETNKDPGGLCSRLFTALGNALSVVSGQRARDDSVEFAMGLIRTKTLGPLLEELDNLTHMNIRLKDGRDVSIPKNFFEARDFGGYQSRIGKDNAGRYIGVIDGTYYLIENYAPRKILDDSLLGQNKEGTDALTDEELVNFLEKVGQKGHLDIYDPSEPYFEEGKLTQAHMVTGINNPRDPSPEKYLWVFTRRDKSKMVGAGLTNVYMTSNSEGNLGSTIGLAERIESPSNVFIDPAFVSSRIGKVFVVDGGVSFSKELVPIRKAGSEFGTLVGYDTEDFAPLVKELKFETTQGHSFTVNVSLMQNAWEIKDRY